LVCSGVGAEGAEGGGFAGLCGCRGLLVRAELKVIDEVFVAEAVVKGELLWGEYGLAPGGGAGVERLPGALSDLQGSGLGIGRAMIRAEFPSCAFVVGVAEKRRGFNHPTVT
jgi:hypothetical protein